MTILVTGSTGTIGSQVLTHLQGRVADVRARRSCRCNGPLAGGTDRQRGRSNYGVAIFSADKVCDRNQNSSAHIKRATGSLQGPAWLRAVPVREPRLQPNTCRARIPMVIPS